MDYYNQIKEKLVDNEIYASVKDYSKERHKVISYYEVGELLSEAGSKYGEDIIGTFAQKLVVEIGKKYDKSTLFKMKKLYNIFSNKKLAPVVPLLNWSQCLILIPLKDINKIYYYALQIKNRNLTKRGLEEIVKSKEYERLDEKTKRKLINNEKTTLIDVIPNPIVIRNNNDIDVNNEKALHNLIIDNIESFMNELGNGYSFIGSEYKIKIGGSFNYIDLLLFNYEYNCFVIVELKVTELQKEHIGQISVYMNYIDKNIKKVFHDKTIGIIICKRDNRYVIEFSSDERIISRTYELI